METNEALLMVLATNFGVLWSGGVDSGVSSRFHTGTDDSLPLVMVTIFVCSGSMMCIQERD